MSNQGKIPDAPLSNLRNQPICNLIGPAFASTPYKPSENAMPLIIRDELVNPPTWFASFRDLTLFCHVFLHVDSVIESEHVDLYYRWLKSRGGMDFVEDFVRPGEVDGVRLDTEHLYPRTILTDRIVPENTDRLIQQIRMLVAA